MPRPNGYDLTRHDLEKTLEAYGKSIELQILISQQQTKLLEQIGIIQDRVVEIEKYLTNGFKTEIKQHTTEQVKEVKSNLENIQEKIEEIDRRTWQQAWIWGGIVLFTLANAAMMIISLLTTK